MSDRRIVLATGNAGKVREIRAILDGLGWDLLTPAEANAAVPPVIETGRSYLENATAKAVALANASGLPALADDSGLEVDALGGRPGVNSAYYGGPGIADDRERNVRLLRELRAIPLARRGARFRATIVLAQPRGAVSAREGVLPGRITEEARGDNGFGYDPVFEPLIASASGSLVPGGRTLAEMGDEKQAISHRAVALHAMTEVLRRLSN